MRADRLLSILLLLQNHGHLTAAGLAQRLEVSERTIYRDIEALSVAGIPVYMERGTGGGIFLPEEYRVGIATNLTESELQSLFVTSNNLLGQLGLHNAFESAMMKLLAALPRGLRQQIHKISDCIYIDNARWRGKEDSVPCLEAVQEAVLAGRYLRFSYRKSEGISTRVAGALGLVAKGTAWYMVAMVDGDIRSYRVSRMQDAEVIDQKVVRPSDFDLETFWKTSVASLATQVPKYTVLLSCTEDMKANLSRLGHWSRVERVEDLDENGGYRVSIVFERDIDAVKCVLENSPQLKVIEPPELKAEVLQRLSAALEAYH